MNRAVTVRIYRAETARGSAAVDWKRVGCNVGDTRQYGDRVGWPWGLFERLAVSVLPPAVAPPHSSISHYGIHYMLFPPLPLPAASL